jgi:hypothetical protein
MSWQALRLAALKAFLQPISFQTLLAASEQEAHVSLSDLHSTQSIRCM